MNPYPPELFMIGLLYEHTSFRSLDVHTLSAYTYPWEFLVRDLCAVLENDQHCNIRLWEYAKNHTSTALPAGMETERDQLCIFITHLGMRLHELFVTFNKYQSGILTIALSGFEGPDPVFETKTR